ncbi:MAG: T9SS C-terminal target domain-containing protein [Calditrichaeota bacterium]|nr:MAG: T9SS C-terminal target domain-containing protein [Calditrichota bacterium]
MRATAFARLSLRFFCMFFFLASMVNLAAANAINYSTTLYVSPAGDDANDGKTLVTSFKTVSQAIIEADDAVKPVQILIEPGIYSDENFPMSLPDSVTVRGRGQAENIIIDGRFTPNRLFEIDNKADCIIANLTLKGGRAESESANAGNGGAIFSANTINCRLDSLIFEDNHAAVSGGAVYHRGDTLFTIQNCIFKNCSADSGGAVYSGENSEVSFINNEMTNNRAASSGGAVYLRIAQADFKNNRIYANIRAAESESGAGGITSFYSKVKIGGNPNDVNDIYDNEGGSKGTQFYAFGDNPIDASYNYWGAEPTRLYVYPDALVSVADYRNVAARIPLNSNELFVSTVGSDANNGTSMTTAFQTLSFAFTQFYTTAVDSFTIYVADGIYSTTGTGESFPVKFDHFSSVVGAGENVVFDAESRIGIPVFQAQNVVSIRLKNVEIRNGNSGTASAANFQKVTGLVVELCRFKNNTAERGAALSIALSRDSQICDNEFINNVANKGGAVCTYLDKSVFERNIFRNNSAKAGGAVLVDSASATQFLQNYFADNVADTGGVVFIEMARPLFYANTMVENHAEIIGGAIALDSASMPQIGGPDGRSNDIYSNSAGQFGSQIARLGAGDKVGIRYNYWGDAPNEALIYPAAEFIADIFLNTSIKLSPTTQKLYLAPDGDDANSGTSAAQAWKTLSYALTQFFGTASRNMELEIAAGTYSATETGENFPVKLRPYTLYNGAGPQTTMFDGGDQTSLFVAQNCKNITVKNMHFSAAKSDFDGSAFAISNCDQILIDNTIFDNNKAENGGACSWKATFNSTLSNTVFNNNAAAKQGGAIFIDSSFIDISNSIFTKNSAPLESGGAVAIVNSSSVNLSNNSFLENRGELGGAVAVSLSRGIFASNRFTTNSSKKGGALYFYGDNESLVGGNEDSSNDFCFNSADELAPEIFAGETDSLNARGNFWGNIPTEVLFGNNPAVHFENFRKVSISLPVATRRIYFSPNGDDNNSGISAASPLQNFEFARKIVAGTADDPIEFYFLSGVYTPENGGNFPFYLKEFVNMTGDSSEAGSVVFDAENRNRIFELEYLAGIKIKQVTIKNGHAAAAEDGGGVRITGSDNVMFDQVHFLANKAESERGGAIAIRSESGNIDILNSTFEKNTAREGGGIVVLSADSLLVQDCRFFNNVATGAAIYAADGFMNLWQNKIYANKAQSTGSALFFTSWVTGAMHLNQIVSNEIMDAEQGGTIAFIQEANVKIGGIPGLGNDIFNNYGGKYGNALVHLGSGESKIEARYNYLGTKDIDELLVSPQDRFRVYPSRDNPIASNNPPAVLWAFPPVGIVEAEPGEEIRFDFTAIDFDNEALSYIWLLNGDGVSRDTTYTIFAGASGSVDSVRLMVMDGTFTTNIEWRIETALSSSIKESDAEPASFALYQNYPNPFNPQTTLVFDLPRGEFVQLQIFDINGRLVNDLITAKMNAGQHRVVWQGNDNFGRTVVSGTYFVRMQAGEFEKMIKLALVR